MYLNWKYEGAAKFCLPSSSIMSLLAPKKSLMINSLGGGGVSAMPFFGVSGDVKCDKSVHLFTYLTDLYDFV